MRQNQIIAMGNANQDIFATIPQLPVEDEKIRISDIIRLPGGSASNYAVSVSRLGGKSIFFGHVGGDLTGQQLVDALRKEGVDTTYVITENQHETGFAFIATTSQGAHIILSYRGANTCLNPSLLPMELLKQSSVLHVSSTPLKIIQDTQRVIQGNEIALSLDPGREMLFTNPDILIPILRTVNLLFVNQVEYEILMGKPPNPQAVTKLARDIQAIVSVQRGAQGVLISNGTQTHKIKAFKVKVVDTTGAGDTYTSSCTLALMRGYDLKQAAVYGCAAAGLNCQVIGARTGMPTHHQTVNFINREGMAFPDYPLNPQRTRLFREML